MFEFKELQVGDMFNTKIDRYVKITDDKAITVFHMLGDIVDFPPDFEVLVLYSAKLKHKESIWHQ